LTAAQTAGTTYSGATNAAAEAALYTAMGGTPDQVAAAFFNACQAAVIAYHSSAAGGPVGAPTGPTANADCTTSSANYTNPS
jgi:Flp pilus assembly protein TadG